MTIETERKDFRDRWTISLILFSALANIATWFFLVLMIRPNPEPIFLHYNIYFGIDLVGESWKVYRIPLIGFLFLLINTGVGVVLFRKEKSFIRLTMGMTVYLELLLALAAFFVVLINR